MCNNNRKYIIYIKIPISGYIQQHTFEGFKFTFIVHSQEGTSVLFLSHHTAQSYHDIRQDMDHQLQSCYIKEAMVEFVTLFQLLMRSFTFQISFLFVLLLFFLVFFYCAYDFIFFAIISCIVL